MPACPPRELFGRRRWLGRAAKLLPTAPALLLLAGCGSSQSTLDPASDESGQISDIWWVMLVVSGVVFAVVLGLVVVAVMRRREERERARMEPRDRYTVGLVAVGGVIVPLLVFAALFAVTVGSLRTTAARAERAPAVSVSVTGRQWFWDVEYPELGIRTANELHLPVGEAVRVTATTDDVIHSFWVPALDRKIDMIPGETNSITFVPNRVGVFRGQCAEFCGLQHANMAFDVIVEPRSRFDEWAKRMARPAEQPSTPEQARGLQVLLGSSCVYCHTIDGTNASGRVGPDLTHVASRRSLGAGTLANTPGGLAGWILDPQHQKPGSLMPGTTMTGPELQALLAYIRTLE